MCWTYDTNFLNDKICLFSHKIAAAKCFGTDGMRKKLGQNRRGRRRGDDGKFGNESIWSLAGKKAPERDRERRLWDHIQCNTFSSIAIIF